MLNRHLVQAWPLAAVLFATGAPAGVELPDFKASYELSRGSMKIGNASLEFSTGANGSYTYTSRSSTLRWVAWFLKGKLYETSHGTITENGFRPDRYHYKRSGGSREREADLTFDWQSLRVQNDVEDSRWGMDILPGTIDKLASQLGMMHALASGETDITFSIADGGKLKAYRFMVVGEETLELPAGTFATVKVSKLREDDSRETLIWCAPALHYLPVRIRRRDKDDSEYQSDLESYTTTPRTSDDNP